MDRREDPFPLEAVRDLLGLVRTMYAAAKAGGAGRSHLARIARIGADLSQAIDLASDTRPGTVGHSAAWRRADDATRRVCDLVDSLTPAEPLVKAASARVSGTKPSVRRKPPER